MDKIQILCFKSFLIFILFFSFTPMIFAAPVPVSPALENGIAVSAGCRPTFSWAADPDNHYCDGYEIAVFAIVSNDIYSATAEEMLADTAPVLEATIPALAQSWTPGLETTGLEAGKSYVWYISSLVNSDNTREWSEGAYFVVNSAELLTTLNQTLKLQSNREVKQTGPVCNYFSPEPGSLLPTLASAKDDADAYRQEIPENSGNRTGSELTGTNNVRYGSGAGHNLTTTGEVSGQATHNTMLGVFAGYKTSSGDHNTFVGNWSGQENQTGDRNVAIGSTAGFYNDAKTDNVFVGYKSGYVSKGLQNTIIGSQAGQQNIYYGSLVANNNTLIGYNSGSFNYGYNNTYIGSGCGALNGNGHGNVFIGYQAGRLADDNNQLYVANSDTSSPLIYGEFDNALLRVNGTLEFTAGYAVSDKRWKKDIKPLPDALIKVKKLNGVSYLWRRDEFPEKGFAQGRQIGLIAQDVEKVLPEVVKTDSKGYKSVAYSNVVPILIEALKKQQDIIEKQNQAIAKQGQAIAELQRLIKK